MKWEKDSIKKERIDMKDKDIEEEVNIEKEEKG
jgi:hypothetical protein